MWDEASAFFCSFCRCTKRGIAKALDTALVRSLQIIILVEYR